MFSRRFVLIFALLFFGLALPGCDNPEQKAAAYIKRGNVLFEQESYDKARIEYKNAARIKPIDPEARFRLGLVDEAQGDFYNAFANYTFAEQQNPRFRPALLKLAQYFLASEQYEQLQQRLDTVLGDAPDDPEAHALHAALLLRQKDYPGAEKEALFAQSKDPANITATSVLTGIYSAQGNIDKAGQAVENGIARNPKDLSLLLLKAMLYERPVNLSKVTEAYEAIFKLKPAEARFRANLAVFYQKAGKIDDAEAVLRAGVATFPDHWGMKRQFVSFLADNRGVDAAEAEIRGYMKAHPDNDDLYFWLADLYLTHKATDKAIALLEPIAARAQMDTPGLNARTSLARIHFAKGNRELAEKLVAAVLEKDPSNHDALFVRANLFFDQGLYQNAVSDLRSILRAQPRAKHVFPLLSEVLLVQGHLDLAIDTLSQLMEIDPENAAGRVRLAQMHNLNGDTKRAIEMLAIVTKINPQYPVGWESTARVALDAKDWAAAEAAITTLDGIPDQRMTATFLKGQLLERTGKTEEALPLYTQVIDADPSSALAEHALSALVDAYQGLGKLDVAFQYIRTLKTDSPFVTTLLGQCAIKLGRLDEGTAAFDKVIAVHAPFQDPYLERAKLYLNSHSPEQALDVLKKAAAAVPADSRASLMAAGILTNSGRYQEAISLYEDILARDPDALVAVNNLAALIADFQHNDSAALEKARKLAERFAGSSDPLLLDTLAWVYFRQGHMQQAQTLMERAMSYGSRLPAQIHYHYGVLLLKAGKTAPAKKELQQAVTEGASYPGLEEAIKLLGTN